MKEKRFVRDVVYLPLLFNVISFALIGASYALAPSLMADYAQQMLVIYAGVFVAECLVAYVVSRRIRGMGISLRTLLSARKPLRVLPAVGVFIVLGGMFIAYMWLSLWTGRIVPLSEVNPLQIIFFIGMIPLASGIVEETAFRGYLIEKMLDNGLTEKKVLVYSALSFAFIHGFFLIDKLIVTFFFGLIAGFYYFRQKNLPVLIITHVFVNVVTFSMTLFGI